MSKNTKIKIALVLLLVIALLTIAAYLVFKNTGYVKQDFLSKDITDDIANTQCTELLASQKEYQAKIPIQVDAVTWLVDFQVDCDKKAVFYTKRLMAGNYVPSEAFIQQRNNDYLLLHCNAQGLATSGWTVQDTVIDYFDLPIITLTATPADCKSI